MTAVDLSAQSEVQLLDAELRDLGMQLGRTRLSQVHAAIAGVLRRSDLRTATIDMVARRAVRPPGVFGFFSDLALAAASGDGWRVSDDGKDQLELEIVSAARYLPRALWFDLGGQLTVSCDHEDPGSAQRAHELELDLLGRLVRAPVRDGQLKDLTLSCAYAPGQLGVRRAIAASGVDRPLAIATPVSDLVGLLQLAGAAQVGDHVSAGPDGLRISSRLSAGAAR